MEPVHIRSMQAYDWDRLIDIYSAGIATGVATLETTLPLQENWDTTHMQEGRLVAENKDKVIGWAALSPVSNRCVYGGVAEVSVYIDPDFRGRGVGKQLLLALIEESEKANIWTLQAGIFPENVASIKLHESSGFRIVGTRERIGKLHNKWMDVVLLERRSEKVGIS